MSSVLREFKQRACAALEGHLVSDLINSTWSGEEACSHKCVGEHQSCLKQSIIGKIEFELITTAVPIHTYFTVDTL